MIDSSILQGKKAAYFTLGCKLNFAETSTVAQQLARYGVRKVQKGEVADIVVVNTCSVTEVADHKCRQAIHRLVKQHPGAFVVVTGCYAQLKPQEIVETEGVDLVLGSEQKGNIIPMIMETLSLTLPRNGEGTHPVSSSTAKNPKGLPPHCGGGSGRWSFSPACSRGDRTRYFLKVQDGCNYYCTYCTIPIARGRSRNGSIASLVEQAEEVAREGGKEIVITGVNIGDFGRSTGETFFDLVKALDKVEGIERYRISSIEPNLLTDEIIEYCAQSRAFMPHFHIPLQSGSNEVLKIMHRHYDRELFAERVAHIRERMPNAFIGVDCMVGVRGETEERWEDYLAFVKQLDVSQLHVFTYSERANTRMLEMDLYVVPKKERERRSKILHAVSAEKLQAFYAKHQGEEATVLWEGKREEGMMAGFTENYIKVHAPYDKTKVNTFEVVRI